MAWIWGVILECWWSQALSTLNDASRKIRAWFGYLWLHLTLQYWNYLSHWDDHAWHLTRRFYNSSKVAYYDDSYISLKTRSGCFPDEHIMIPEFLQYCSSRVMDTPGPHNLRAVNLLVLSHGYNAYGGRTAWIWGVILLVLYSFKSSLRDTAPQDKIPSHDSRTLHTGPDLLRND